MNEREPASRFPRSETERLKRGRTVEAQRMLLDSSVFPGTKLSQDPELRKHMVMNQLIAAKTAEFSNLESESRQVHKEHLVDLLDHHSKIKLILARVTRNPQETIYRNMVRKRLDKHAGLLRAHLDIARQELSKAEKLTDAEAENMGHKAYCKSTVELLQKAQEEINLLQKSKKKKNLSKEDFESLIAPTQLMQVALVRAGSHGVRGKRKAQENFLALKKQMAIAVNRAYERIMEGNEKRKSIV